MTEGRDVKRCPGASWTLLGSEKKKCNHHSPVNMVHNIQQQEVIYLCSFFAHSEKEQSYSLFLFFVCLFCFLLLFSYSLSTGLKYRQDQKSSYTSFFLIHFRQTTVVIRDYLSKTYFYSRFSPFIDRDLKSEICIYLTDTLVHVNTNKNTVSFPTNEIR